MNFELTICFSELEIMNQKLLNVGMFADGTAAVADVFEFFFFKIVLVHCINKTVIRIRSVF